MRLFTIYASKEQTPHRGRGTRHNRGTRAPENTTGTDTTYRTLTPHCYSIVKEGKQDRVHFHSSGGNRFLITVCLHLCLFPPASLSTSPSISPGSVIENPEHGHNAVGCAIGATDVAASGTDAMDGQPDTTCTQHACCVNNQIGVARHVHQ